MGEIIESEYCSPPLTLRLTPPLFKLLFRNSWVLLFVDFKNILIPRMVNLIVINGLKNLLQYSEVRPSPSPRVPPLSSERHPTSWPQLRLENLWLSCWPTTFNFFFFSIHWFFRIQHWACWKPNVSNVCPWICSWSWICNKKISWNNTIWIFQTKIQWFQGTALLPSLGPSCFLFGPFQNVGSVPQPIHFELPSTYVQALVFFSLLIMVSNSESRKRWKTHIKSQIILNLRIVLSNQVGFKFQIFQEFGKVVMWYYPLQQYALERKKLKIQLLLFPSSKSR